jgi:rhamnosyltransferase subunit B
MHPHFIFLCVGTTGDIHPFMRLAKTFQSLGRRVTFITNTHHARLLNGSGLPFVGLGTAEDFLRVIQNPDVWDQKKGFATLLAPYGEQLAQVDAAIRSVVDQSPTVVFAHPLGVPGAVIAREQGLVKSVVACYLAPTALRTCHGEVWVGPTKMPKWLPLTWRKALWRFVEKGWIDPIGLKQVNARRSQSKLPAVSTSFLAHLEQTPDLVVTLFPSWFGPVMPDWPKHLLTGDFQLFDAEPANRFSPELTAFLAAGDQPFVFTPGTGNLHAAAFFSHALTAVTQLRQRAIFLTSDKAQLPANLPANVLWQPYVSLSGLLPHTAALVHHGGIGTTAEALRAGTPQLVVPFGWDQYDNGARVASLGAGLVITAKDLNARKLTHALQTLTTSDRIRHHCAQVANRFVSPSDPAVLCMDIEQQVAAG